MISYLLNTTDTVHSKKQQTLQNKNVRLIIIQQIAKRKKKQSKMQTKTRYRY